MLSYDIKAVVFDCDAGKLTSSLHFQELTRKRNRDSESDGGACLDENDDLESEIQNDDSEDEDEIETKRCRYEVRVTLYQSLRYTPLHTSSATIVLSCIDVTTAMLDSSVRHLSCISPQSLCEDQYLLGTE